MYGRGNCHYNFHEGQFSKECDDCHTTEQWAPLTNFDITRKRVIDSMAPTHRSTVENVTSTISTREHPMNAVIVISTFTMANSDRTVAAATGSMTGR